MIWQYTPQQQRHMLILLLIIFKIIWIRIYLNIENIEIIVIIINNNNIMQNLWSSFNNMDMI